MKKIQIPTGYLFTDTYSKGELETLSIGDYGKSQNVKADFLGYTKIIEGVPSGYCKPLTEKWVITLSTQYGCPMKCTFCDVPNVKFRGNATFEDLQQQLFNAIKLFPSIRYTERLNIHFARMGEPVFNPAVIEFSKWLFDNKKYIQDEFNLRIEVIHPVLTSSMPKAVKYLESVIQDWIYLKNNVYNGQAGLQISINSTSEEQRNDMFQNQQLSLNEISEIGKQLPVPIGRKYCLNFAFSTDYEIDANKLVKLFSPDKFMVKITPIHNNNACRDNNIKTEAGYSSWQPYEKPEQDLKDVGFDVLVFVPSMDEEDGLVTCGNVVLGGGQMELKESILKIQGL